MTNSYAEHEIPGTCPKCGNSHILRSAPFTPLIGSTAATRLGNARRPPIPEGAAPVPQPREAQANPEHAFAANPPVIRCSSCNLQWTDEEIDPTTARFASLSAHYQRRASASNGVT